MTTTNRSVPEATVIPVLVYPDVVEATDWLCNAFGFSVRLRIAEHRATRHGDGAVTVTSGSIGDNTSHSSVSRTTPRPTNDSWRRSATSREKR